MPFFALNHTSRSSATNSAASLDGTDIIVAATGKKVGSILSHVRWDGTRDCNIGPEIHLVHCTLIQSPKPRPFLSVCKFGGPHCFQTAC